MNKRGDWNSHMRLSWDLSRLFIVFLLVNSRKNILINMSLKLFMEGIMVLV